MTRWLAILAVLLVTGWQLVFALQVLRSDPVYFLSQRQVVYWGEDGREPTLEQVLQVQEAVNGAVAAWPENGDYRALQARLYLWQALLATERRSANQRLQEAVHSLEQSFRHRPAHPYAWLQYAEYLAVRRNDLTDLEAAITKVQELGPGDPELQAAARALMPQ